MNTIAWTYAMEDSLAALLVHARMSAEDAGAALGLSADQLRELVAECRDDSRLV